MIVEPSDLFITNREVGRMLGLSRRSVIKVCQANGVRTRTIPGIRCVRFYRPDVERLLSASDTGPATRSPKRILEKPAKHVERAISYSVP
jgi:hypothetical protein